jgi:hypothetical protein
LFNDWNLTDLKAIVNLKSLEELEAQVSVHLTKRFQRRRLKCEKLTDDIRQTPSDEDSILIIYNEFNHLWVKSLGSVFLSVKVIVYWWMLFERDQKLGNILKILMFYSYP